MVSLGIDGEGAPTPRATVVLTTFNRPEMVVRAVDSVLAQTFDAWELLLIDDNAPGSATRDATFEALQAPLRDPRVRYLPQPKPAGGSAARNAGARAARAPWIAFLDDDDTWAPEKLERQFAALKHSADDPVLVYTGLTAVSPQGRTLWHSIPRPGLRLYPDLLGRNVIGTTSCVLCRRDILLAVGGFDETLPAAQDRDLYIRLCRDHAAVAVPLALVGFVQHRGNRISNDKGKKYEAEALLLRKYEGAYARYPRMRSRALTHLGRYAWLSRRGHEARRHLRAAIATDPTNLEAYRLWAGSFVDPQSYRRWRGSAAGAAPRASTGDRE